MPKTSDVLQTAVGDLAPIDAKLDELCEYMDGAIREALGDRYPVVDEPGPGVARLRVAITDIDKSNPVLNALPQMQLTGSGIGGASMEAELLDSVPTIAHVDYYSRIVREKAWLRELLKAANEIMVDAYDEGPEVEEVLDRAEKRIFDIVERRITTSLISVEELVHPVFNWVDDLHKAVAWLEEQGVRFTPGGIRRGASGHDVCFIHPKGNEQTPLSGEGVLVELVQAPPDVIEALSE